MPYATRSVAMFPPQCGLRGSRVASHEFVDFSLRFVALVAVAFLYFTDQLFCFAFYAIDVIVCKLAPAGLHFAFELLPFAFQDVFIHCFAPHADTSKTRASMR